MAQIRFMLCGIFRHVYAWIEVFTPLLNCADHGEPFVLCATNFIFAISKAYR